MLPVTSPVNTGSQAVNSSQHKIEQLNQGNQDVLPEVELPINQQQSVLNAQTSILGHPIRREHGTNIYADRQRREYIYPTGWALGQTSEGEETSGKGPGTINGKKSARIDRGGRSYGSSQITEANMPDYLKHSRFRDEFKGMKVNSKEFNETWIRLGKEKPEEFRQDQHDYIQRTHYESLISNLRRKGIDIADRGPAIKDMLWSTAVQYGSNSDVIENALQNKNLNQVSNEEIITAVQEYKKNNVDRLFRRLLQNIRDKKEREEYRQSLINRASREKSKLLKLEKQSKPDWINK
jgi:vgrG protein